MAVSKENVKSAEFLVSSPTRLLGQSLGNAHQKPQSSAARAQQHGNEHAERDADGDYIDDLLFLGCQQNSPLPPGSAESN